MESHFSGSVYLFFNQIIASTSTWRRQMQINYCKSAFIGMAVIVGRMSDCHKINFVPKNKFTGNLEYRMTHCPKHANRVLSQNYVHLNKTTFTQLRIHGGGWFRVLNSPQNSDGLKMTRCLVTTNHQW